MALATLRDAEHHAAKRVLSAKGRRKARIVRIERVSSTEVWILHILGGEAYTAICDGAAPAAWQLREVMCGWPVPA